MLPALDVPTHGITRGYRVISMVVNLYKCERPRRSGRWQVARRSMRIPGSAETAAVYERWLSER